MPPTALPKKSDSLVVPFNQMPSSHPLHPRCLLWEGGHPSDLSRVSMSGASSSSTAGNNSLRWEISSAAARASGKRGMYLTDANGDRHDCVVEAFTQKHQVFILIHCVKTLGPPAIVL